MNAFRVDRHTDIFGLIALPRLEGAHMGRCFDEDAIPRVQEDLAEHIQGLLGATRHQTLSG